jgi:Flp pilus assembly protein CpaB
MFQRKLPLASKVYVGAAVLTGALAFILFKAEAAKVQALVPKVGAPRAVVEANGDIARDSQITADQLRVVRFPANFSPPGAVADPSSVIGRVVESRVADGEPITLTRLAPVRAGPVAALVPEDLRGFIIPVTVPAGSVRAGDHVDVFATYAGGRPHTEAVVSDAEVLNVLSDAGSDSAGGLPAAAGGTVAMHPGGSTDLVLLVGPSDAESLAYATTFGAISIAIEPASTSPPGGGGPSPGPVLGNSSSLGTVAPSSG